MAASTPPIRLVSQLQLQPGILTLLYTVPEEVTIATASVELTNFSESTPSEKNTIWFVPAGSTTPQPLSRIAFSPLTSTGSSLIRFGLSVSAGDKFYAQASGTEVNAMVNAVAHMKQA